MRKASVPGACLIVLIVLLALLPGCGCAADRSPESLFDDRADPCAPPPIGGGGAVSFAQSVKFLYEGACPRQTGVDKAVFDELRVSVVRGRVVGEDGAPLKDVRVRAAREGRYGETRTGQDGRFDYVVNGGARTRLRFELEGRLLAQRNADPKTSRFLVLEDVALVLKSATTTALSFGGDGWQVASGDLSADQNAPRRVRILVPPGTKAATVKPDGSREPLAAGTLRITEFTRGQQGPAAMPSELPPASGYTYASSFLVDEAGPDASVEFESPVIAYLENFLAMKDGASVPSGALGEGADGWKAEPSGRVVRLTSGDVATLDTNGDGAADSPQELAALGIPPEELRAIAGAAPSGSYFRVLLKHFSSWDFNWGFGPPPDAAFPPPGEGFGLPDLPCITTGGSYFECERQTLGEDIPLVGTDASLHYHSDRVAGYRGSASFTVPVTPAQNVPSLKRAEVEISVLGTTETKSYAPAPNLEHTFTWNGLDAYGRSWPSETVAEVRVGLVYDGVYVDTKSFGAFGTGQDISGDRTRKEVVLNRRYEYRVGTFQQLGLGMGGWSLSSQHVYDPSSRTLYRGDGGRRNSDGIGANVRAFAGIARYGSGGIDGPKVAAAEARFGSLTGIAIDESGALFVAESSGAEDVRKIDGGSVTSFAGSGPAGHTGDGGPATQARLNTLRGIVALRDGRVCFSEFYDDRIRCVGTDGILRAIAGGGTKELGAQPVPALEAKLTRPGELAEGPDGSIYVTFSAISMVARIDRAGTIEIAVGGGTDTGENVPALKVDLQPRGLAVAPDGTIFIAEPNRNRVRRVDPSGRVSTIAGTGEAGNAGDGGLALSATFRGPIALALNGEGALYVSDHGNARIRRIEQGKVHAFAGGGDRRTVQGAAARLASATVAGMVVARDGTLYAVSEDDNTVLSFAAPFPGGAAGDIAVPSDEGAEIYVFDGRGHHLRTLDGLTSDVLTTFAYDGAGLLTKIEDRHGNVLQVTRDASGRATQLTAPFGHVTTLAYGADGWLSTITDAIGRKESFAYAPGGLLTQRVDAGGGVHVMAYDEKGKLTRDATAENASFALASDGIATSVTTGLGRREVHSFRGGAGRDEVRTYQATDGTSTSWTVRRDGTANVTFANGTSVDVTREADPRLGMLVPYAAKHVVTLPSGLVRADSQVWTAQQDAAGLLTELKIERTSPDGRSTTVYDGKTRVTTTTSAEGRVVKVTLDAEGRVARTEYPGRAPIIDTYDDRGRLTITDDGGRVTRTTYDPKTGEIATVTNALGQTVGAERDGALRVTGFVHADGAKTHFAWSPMDDVLGLTPPGKQQHAMTFDRDGNEVGYAAPAAGVLGSQYDLDRALTRVTHEDGSASALGYDGAGRVDTVTYPGGQLSLAYDPKTSLLRSVTAPASSLTLGYDGVLLRDVTASGPAPGTVSFTYDAMLRRSVEQVGPSIAKYTYDRDGLATGMGAITLGRESATGRLSGIDVGDAGQRFKYTPFGEVASYRSQGAGGNLLDVTMTYDALERIVDRAENGVTWHYDYDARGRLVRVRKDGVETAAYAYDANGNRADGGATVDAQDRVTAMNGVTYTYSPLGERKSRTTGVGQTTYAYDGRGYLVTVDVPGGVRTDYDIDAFGRRITRRTNGSVQNRFLYRNALQPIADVDDQGAVVTRFLYGRGELGPDAMERGGATYLLLKDERGSIRFVVDATGGTVVQALEYDAFGRVLLDTAPGFQPFGFAGGMYDADTGLVHFGARDYDPETGSFTRKDPSRFGGGENLYAYADGDPVNFVDPDGLGIGGALLGGVEGGAVGYAEEGAVQVLDKDFTGLDCGKLRSAAGWGAAFGAAAGASKSTGQQCFAAGTPVATAQGSRAIEDVAVGDRVLSRGEDGALSYAPVTRLFVRPDAEQVVLTFSDANDRSGAGTASIVTTPEHPFRMASGEWVPAGRLDIGDNVETAEGKLATLSAALSLQERGTVYNFEVAGTHTYFVGDAKLWVHNACKRPPIKPGVRAGRGESGRHIPKASKDAVDAANPKNQCVFCGAVGKGTHYDHALPYSHGGSSENPGNLQKACPWCNQSKGAGDYPKNPPPGYQGGWPPPWWP